ncbi:MAG: prolyl-tRNA synthetase associated domain-containing protein, partial [Alphaproteobacteria bacterium]|nr:prolyl-tRNA synthetase associated domain-containing protein [Alphaproteobacteria bacterium]
ARLSFGSPERLWAHLGIRPGAVCPFTVINDPERRVNLLLDEAMMAAERVCYHPLDNAMTVSLAPADLMKFFDFTGHAPHILDFRPAAPDNA